MKSYVSFDQADLANQAQCAAAPQLLANRVHTNKLEYKVGKQLVT